ncbi:MAG: energy-coupling factor transporter transmembrane component T [Nitrospirota bacterium]
MRRMVLNLNEKHDSPVHRIEPTVKLFIFFYLIIILYLVKDIYGNLIILSVILLVARISTLPMVRLFKGIYIFIALAAFTHLFFTPGKPILPFNLAFINVTEEGLKEGIFISLRLTNMVLTASVLTLTTSPEKLTEGLRRILYPVERIGVPIQRFSFMIALSLRFIPMLITEVNQTVDAGLNHIRNNKNKSKDNKFFGHAKEIIPAISELFVRIFSMADEIIASGNVPPPLKQSALRKRDKLAITGISALFVIGLVLLI